MWEPFFPMKPVPAAALPDSLSLESAAQSVQQQYSASLVRIHHNVSLAKVDTSCIKHNALKHVQSWSPLQTASAESVKAAPLIAHSALSTLLLLNARHASRDFCWTTTDALKRVKPRKLSPVVVYARAAHLFAWHAQTRQQTAPPAILAHHLPICLTTFALLAVLPDISIVLLHSLVQLVHLHVSNAPASA